QAQRTARPLPGAVPQLRRAAGAGSGLRRRRQQAVPAVRAGRGRRRRGGRALRAAGHRLPQHAAGRRAAAGGVRGQRLGDQGRGRRRARRADPGWPRGGGDRIRPARGLARALLWRPLAGSGAAAGGFSRAGRCLWPAGGALLAGARSDGQGPVTARTWIAFAALATLLLAATLAWHLPMMLWDHIDLAPMYEAWQDGSLASSAFWRVHDGSHLHVAAYAVLLATTWASGGQPWLDCLASFAVLAAQAIVLVRIAGAAPAGRIGGAWLLLLLFIAL